MFTMTDDRQDAPQWRVMVYESGSPQFFQDFDREPQADSYADKMRKIYADDARKRPEGACVIFVRKEKI